LGGRLRARLKESIIAAGLDEEAELLTVLLIDLIFDLSLFYCQLEYKLVLLIKLMLERIRQDRQDIELPRLVVAEDLHALVTLYHFFVELSVVDLLLHNIHYYHLAGVLHLQVTVSVERVLHEAGLVAAVGDLEVLQNIVDDVQVLQLLHVELMLYDFSILLPVFQLEGLPSFVDDLPLFFYELLFRVTSYQDENVHEPIEGEESHFVELHLSEAF